MPGSEDATSDAASRKAKVSVRKQQYLVLYNLASAISWFVVLSRVCILLPIAGYRNVYGGVGEYTKWTQSAAVLEILHSTIGRSSELCFHLRSQFMAMVLKSRKHFCNCSSLRLVQPLTMARPCPLSTAYHVLAGRLALGGCMAHRRCAPLRHDAVAILY